MKIRTDFVTNSSSSSFVLEITITTQDGNTISFFEYSDADAGKEFCVSSSPRQLAMASNVGELVKMLKDNVLPFWGPTSSFIKQVNEIPSMSRIRSIMIRGDESNYLNFNRTYFYDRLTGEYKYTMDGYYFEKDGSSGGDLEFSDDDLAKEVDSIFKSQSKQIEALSDTNYLDKELSVKFYGDTTDIKILIPDSIKIIAENAFSNKIYESFFTSVEEIVLPSSIEEIGWGCFKNLPNLKRIVIPENERYEVVNDAIIEKSTQTIIAYYGKEKGEYIVPENVKYIANWTFSRANFTSVVLPDSVCFIGERSFAHCYNLKNINIPKLAFKISDVAFADSKNVNLKVCEGSFAHKLAQKQKLNFEFVAYEQTSTDFLIAKNIVITGFSESEKGEITELIEKNGGIVKSAVSSKTDILVYDSKYPTETVKLKKAKELIACGKPITILTDVEFCDILDSKQKFVPNVIETPKDEIIPNGNLLITGIDKIPAKAYKDRLDIISVEISEDVKEIGRDAFSGCKNLEKIVLKNGLQIIDDRAFAKCKKLIEIDIPRTVKKIGKRAFLECKSLNNVKLHEGITQIAESTFENDKSLKKINIPKSVLIIKENAFYGCNVEARYLGFVADFMKVKFCQNLGYSEGTVKVICRDGLIQIDLKFKIVNKIMD